MERLKKGRFSPGRGDPGEQAEGESQLRIAWHKDLPTELFKGFDPWRRRWWRRFFRRRSVAGGGKGRRWRDAQQLVDLVLIRVHFIDDRLALAPADPANLAGETVDLFAQKIKARLLFF